MNTKKSKVAAVEATLVEQYAPLLVEWLQDGVGNDHYVNPDWVVNDLAMALEMTAQRGYEEFNVAMALCNRCGYEGDSSLVDIFDGMAAKARFMLKGDRNEV